MVFIGRSLEIPYLARSCTLSRLVNLVKVAISPATGSGLRKLVSTKHFHSFYAGIKRLIQAFPNHDSEQNFRLERDFLYEIEDAFERLPRTLSEVLDINNWNFDSLKHRDGEPRKYGVNHLFRKPKLVIDVVYTMKGNLALTWSPAPGYENDLVYGSHYDAKAAYERPRNELLFIRNFGRASTVAAEGSFFGHVDRNRLCQMLEVVYLLIEEVISQLSMSCDVVRGSRLYLTYHRVDYVEAHVENERERIERLSRVPDVPDIVDELAEAKDYKGFEQRYGVSPFDFIGFVKATRRYRMPKSVMAQILRDRHGLLECAWLDGFDKIIDKFEFAVSVDLALARKSLPFEGTPLQDLKAMFAASFPDRKSWHVGEFTPKF